MHMKWVMMRKEIHVLKLQGHVSIWKKWNKKHRFNSLPCFNNSCHLEKSGTIHKYDKFYWGRHSFSMSGLLLTFLFFQCTLVRWHEISYLTLVTSYLFLERGNILLFLSATKIPTSINISPDPTFFWSLGTI